MAFPEGERSSKLEVCGANIPLEDALLASASETYDSSPSPNESPVWAGLIASYKTKKENSE